MSGKCKYNPCKFIHVAKLCALFYSTEKCNGTCGKNHFVSQELNFHNTNFNANKTNSNTNKTNSNTNRKNLHHKKKPTNTETFKQDFTPPEMRILFEHGLSKSKISPLYKT